MTEYPFASYASVVIEKGPPSPLDYGVPASLKEQIQLGTRVTVPLRNRTRTGIVTALLDSSAQAGIQPILAIQNDLNIPSDLLKLAHWMASYYLASETATFRCIAPSYLTRNVRPRKALVVSRAKSREALAQSCIELRSKARSQAAVLELLLESSEEIPLADLLKSSGASHSAITALQKKKLLLVSEKSVAEPLRAAEFFLSAPKQLNKSQGEAVARISHTLQEGVYATHLLYGVTGSGKTEVYLRAMECALAAGKGIIVLVPEIALTEQTMERFRARFREEVGVLHHRLSDNERSTLWHQFKDGQVRIAVGPRSAVFSPMKNLGLIIVDEEHDPSYKQSDQSPCYHGRDVAIMRALFTSSTTILGSATPSLESYANALGGKYLLSTLHERADGASMPSVRIVDMKRATERASGFTLFSDELLTAIERRYSAGEQTILFLNRRGYFAMQWCSGCRKAVQCPSCDLNLTFHRGDNALSCHLCGYCLTPPPQRCPHCSASDPLRFRGAGTEQVEQALRRVFPELRTLRCDADTTRKKESHQQIMRSFRSGKADVLIGTQMIAKGLHFPQVTLVGVIHGDAGLHIPDFRASEYAFQLITQVAGRAGRAQMGGEVIIQSYMPDNATLQLAARQDYSAFYEQESQVRQLFGFPPFAHLVKVTLSGPKAAEVEMQAVRLRHLLVKRLTPGSEALPVGPCGYPKINDQYRFQFLLRGPQMAPLAQALRQQLTGLIGPSGVRIRVDVGPVSTYS